MSFLIHRQIYTVTFTARTVSVGEKIATNARNLLRVDVYSSLKNQITRQHRGMITVIILSAVLNVDAHCVQFPCEMQRLPLKKTILKFDNYLISRCRFISTREIHGFHFGYKFLREEFIASSEFLKMYKFLDSLGLNIQKLRVSNIVLKMF